MSMNKADEAVSELVVDINDKQKVLDAIMHLQNLYPDLKVQRDGRISSFSSIKFCSAAVNSIVDDVDVTKGFKSFESLARNEEMIEAWPFTTVEGYKIYSDPPCFVIGHTNNLGFGVNPTKGWDDIMEESGVPKAAIRAARDYIRKNPPIFYSLHNQDQDTENP